MSPASVTFCNSEGGYSEGGYSEGATPRVAMVMAGVAIVVAGVAIVVVGATIDVGAIGGGGAGLTIIQGKVLKHIPHRETSTTATLDRGWIGWRHDLEKGPN